MDDEPGLSGPWSHPAVASCHTHTLRSRLLDPERIHPFWPLAHWWAVVGGRRPFVAFHDLMWRGCGVVTLLPPLPAPAWRPLQRVLCHICMPLHVQPCWPGCWQPTERPAVFSGTAAAFSGTQHGAARRPWRRPIIDPATGFRDVIRGALDAARRVRKYAAAFCS